MIPASPPRTACRSRSTRGPDSRSNEGLLRHECPHRGALSSAATESAALSSVGTAMARSAALNSRRQLRVVPAGSTPAPHAGVRADAPAKLTASHRLGWHRSRRHGTLRAVGVSPTNPATWSRLWTRATPPPRRPAATPRSTARDLCRRPPEQPRDNTRKYVHEYETVLSLVRRSAPPPDAGPPGRRADREEVSVVSGGSGVVDRTCGRDDCIITIVQTPNGDGYIACAGHWGK